MKRGRYIVLDGGDGSGKSTQVQRLLARLRSYGIKCIEIEEPGGTVMADTLKGILKNKEIDRHPKTNALLFLAARADAWNTVYGPKLQEGIWVISSRSYLSTLAYQGYGEGVDLDDIIASTKMWLPKDYTKPGAEIILMVDVPTIQERMRSRDLAAAQADTFESKGADFHERVRQGYIELSQQNGRHLVDASQSEEKVAADIYQIIRPIVDDWFAT